MDERDSSGDTAETPARRPATRAAGSPLPRGSVRRSLHALREHESWRTGPLPPGRALSGPASSDSQPGDQPSNVQRAVNALRSVFPLVQRALPLLDGNIGAALAGVLSSRPHGPAPTVNLAPIEDSVTALQTQHQELHERVAEQNTSLKRVEDQLEMVREATDRNTLEQQELLEDLRRMGTKFNGFALAAMALLAASVILNVILYLHIQHVLP